MNSPLSISEMPQQPLVVVASLLCVGVVLGWMVLLTWWQLLLIGTVWLWLYIYSRRWWMGLLLVLYTGFSATMIHRLVLSDDLSGEGYYMLEVESEAHGESRGVAQVSSRAIDGEVEWQRLSGEVRYREDGDISLRSGDRAIVWCRVWEFRGRYYSNFNEKSVLSCVAADDRKVDRWSERVNRWATSRIAQLGLTSEAEAMCSAMLLGRRELLGEEILLNHRRSGAAHVLALSGLHVMVIYLIIDKILLLLNTVPFGFRLRPILMALIIWGYAMVVGMTPSVERAAIMFIILQLFRLLSRNYDSLLGLLIAASIMLFADPSIVFDVGFLLSVVAVFAILMWVVPIEGRIRSLGIVRYGGWSWIGAKLFSVLLVGFVCSMATLPLVSLAFGYISPLGVLLNPVVIITSFLLISLSLLWVIFGVAPLETPFRWALDMVAKLQCEAVEYMSSGWRDAIDVRLSVASVVVIYTLYIVATVVVWRSRDDQ